MNLYAANQATIAFNGEQIEVIQETDHPWSGDVKLTVRPERPTTFELNLRIPSWYEKITAAINGQQIEAAHNENGYLCLNREWKPDDTITLDLHMPVQRVIAHPSITSNIRRVALRRGPVVYCLEGIDNGGSVQDIVLPREADLEAHFEKDLLGGVTILRGNALRRKPVDWENRLYKIAPEDEETEITAIPYYAWDNRDKGQMVVWVPESTTDI